MATSFDQGGDGGDHSTVEWKITIEGTDAFGEVRRHEIQVELCRILGDGVDQAADFSWFATSIPSRNFTPRTIFGN